MALQIKVLILKCEYIGVYDSFYEFYHNIEYMFAKSSVEIQFASNIKEAIEILKTNTVSFTVNVGQYPYYINGRPLYDIFETLNYQWIIDNPLRYQYCDMKSKYNRMIYIDRQFALYPGCGRIDFLNISLPYPEYRKTEKVNISKAVLAPIKVKDLDSYKRKIETSDDKFFLKEFIKEYDINESFNMLMIRYLSEKSINNPKEFFEIANGYIRVKKRELMLRAIKTHEVLVFSDIPKNMEFDSNIVFVGRKKYHDLLNLQNDYNIILNCNPNFDYCIHDRVSYGIMNGKVVISDINEMLSSVGMPLCFSYSDMSKLDDVIDDALNDFELFHSKQLTCLTKGIVPCANQIIDNFLKFR